MHFAFITLGYHPCQTGGAFRYVTQLAEGLAGRGHEVEAIFPAENVRPETRNGVRLHPIESRRKSFWTHWRERNRMVRELLKEIYSRDPQTVIVLCHGYFARAALAISARKVSLFTGPWAEEFLQSNTLASKKAIRQKVIAPMMRRIERAGLQNSQAIATISEYYRKALPQWHRGLSTSIHVIGGGVDADHFKPPADRDKTRADFGVRSQDFVFVAVRRLEPRMGLLNLIEAFKGVSATLWIAGVGSQQAELEERIRALNLQDRVKLLGFVPEAELPARYGAADCAVMPSLDLEGFGLATVEALACGTPVIGSRRGATPEILEPLGANLLYETPDELTGLLQNTEMLPSRERCRAYIESHFPWDQPVQKFEALCLEALA